MKWILLTTSIILSAGCATMRTTPVTRQDDDSFCVQCPANGVPVTIRVPTHLEVSVYEQLFYKLTDDQRIQLVNKDCNRNYKVQMNPIESEKVIFVDVKRPAGGTLDYNLEFDSKGQSITQYESFVFDRSLEDSANLLAQLVPGASQQTSGSTKDGGPDSDFGSGTPGTATTQRQSAVFDQREPKAFDGSSSPSFDPSIFVRKRIVAFQIFDINAVDFEEQVQGFLAQHLNSCHDCNSNPAAIVSDGTAPTKNTGVQQSSRQNPESTIASRTFDAIPSNPAVLSNPVQQ